MLHTHPIRRFLCRSSFASAAGVALLASTIASAQIAYVDTQGREWRQVDGLVNVTWLQVEAICPTDGITPCAGSLAGIDLSGWVWANTDQVTELFAEFVPQIVGQPSLGGPSLVLPALFFFGSFAPTFEFYTTFGGYNYLSAWTSTERDGLAGVAEVSATWNAFDSIWNVAAQASVSTASVYRGVWLVHLPAPICTADLDGDGGVDAADLGALLGAWGPAEGGPVPADLDANGMVDAADLGALLGAWGPC